MSRREVGVAGALLVLGVTQMVAQVANLPSLRALAAATGASPAPKVFSAVQGLETYSTAFHVDWTDRDGGYRSTMITPALYRRVAGPYNRRNVYGAVLAFGPVMATNPATAPMFRAVLRSALCGDGRLLREIGLDPAAMTGVRVRLEPLRPEALGSLPRTFAADCW
jgi:hypothetical protein